MSRDQIPGKTAFSAPWPHSIRVAGTLALKPRVGDLVFDKPAQLSDQFQGNLPVEAARFLKNIVSEFHGKIRQGRQRSPGVGKGVAGFFQNPQKRPQVVVWRNATERAERCALSNFSAACWQGNPIIASLLRMSRPSAAATDSSSSALASRTRACSSCFIKRPAVLGRLVIDVAPRIRPVFEFLTRHHHKVDVQRQIPQALVQPCRFRGGILDFLLGYEPVDIALRFGLSTGERTNQQDSPGMRTLRCFARPPPRSFPV